MNRYVILFSFLLTSFTVCLLFPATSLAQEHTRWWQREIQQPSPGQAVNSEYVAKRRELERAWDDFRSNQRNEAHFRAMGQKTTALQAAIQEAWRKVNRLENELSHIPMYVLQEPADAHSPPPSESSPSAGVANPLVESAVEQELTYMGSERTGLSVIRVRFAPFPYYDDNSGTDYRSYGQLRDITEYRVAIHPEQSMNTHYSAIQGEAEMKRKYNLRQGITLLPTPDGDIKVDAAGGLLGEPRLDVEKHLRAGTPLIVKILAGKLPPFGA